MKNNSTNIMRLKMRRKFAVLVAFIIVMTMLLPLLIPGIVYAGTTLSIIQDRTNLDRPLKPFIYVGETIDFDAILNGDAIGGTTTSHLTWTVSDTNVASLGTMGQVTGLSTGGVTVTVNYNKEKEKASSAIYLEIKQKVNSVDLSATSMGILVGDSEYIYAYPNPSEATYAGNGIAFSSSDSSVAAVGGDGHIYAYSKGVATIYATFVNIAVLKGEDGSYADVATSAACTVYVSNRPVTGITLDRTALQYLYLTKTMKFNATVSPTDATVKDVSWSLSDPSLATVSQSGLVTAIAEGTVTVTATAVDSGHTASCNIEMEYFNFEQVELDSDDILVRVGSENTIKAVYTPGYTTWAVSDPLLAAISTSGTSNDTCKIVGLAKGDVTVTASSIYEGRHVESTCVVHVRNIPPSGLNFESRQKTIYVGDTVDLSATISPPDTTIKDITYKSSDVSIATVDTDGKVTAIRTNVNKESGAIIGDCVISAVIEGEDEHENIIRRYDMCDLTVLNVEPTAVEMTPVNLTLTAGDEPVALRAVVKPDNTTVKDLVYRSENDAFVTVDDDGLITPVCAGETKVFATSSEDKDVFGVCNVIVKAVYSEKIVVVKDDIMMGKGYTAFIQLMAAPGDVTFESSDTDIATVDRNGYITGVERGRTKIVLRSHDDLLDVDVTKTIDIWVIQCVETIVLDKEVFALSTPGGTLEVHADVYPDDADIKTLKWVSSNENIATVDDDGVISSKGYGTATVTAKATDGSDVTAEVRVDVAIPIAGIELDTMLRSKTIYIDGVNRESFDLNAVILPDEATHREVTWTTSDDSVFLTPSGDNNESCRITARRASGDVVITASDYRGDNAISFHVTVKVKITSVGIALVPKDGYTDGDSIIAVNTKDNLFQLMADAYPEGAEITSIVWESLSSNVSIDSLGNVTIPKGTKTGTYDVKVTLNDGEVTAIKHILVVQGVRSIMLLSLDESLPLFMQHLVVEGTTISMATEIFPINAYNKDLIVSSTNTDVATAEFQHATGLITVVGEFLGWLHKDGTTICATAADGGGITASHQVSVVSEPD